jgi:hypothetical protein
MELLRYVMHGKHNVVVRHHQSVRCGGWLLWGLWNLTSSILISPPLWILRMSIALHDAEFSCLGYHHDNCLTIIYLHGIGASALLMHRSVPPSVRVHP